MYICMHARVRMCVRACVHAANQLQDQRSDADESKADTVQSEQAVQCAMSDRSPTEEILGVRIFIV